MADNGASDGERLLMEQIRQLDTEQLEVEEVDDRHHHSSSEEETSEQRRNARADPYSGITFDTCLPSLHTYLGEIDDTHHYLSFFDGGTILDLPMFYLEGIVLFPEATIPFRVVQSRFKLAVERALKQTVAPNIIGVVRAQRTLIHGLSFALVGTTAEIRQYRRLEDESLNVVARGRQRFCVRQSWIDVEGTPYAKVEIMKEDVPLKTPRDAFGQLASIVNFSSGHATCLDSPSSSELAGSDNDSDCSRQDFPTSVPNHSDSEKVDEYASESDDEDGDPMWWRGVGRSSSVGQRTLLRYNTRFSGTGEGGGPEENPSSPSTEIGSSSGRPSANERWMVARKAWAMDEKKWLHRAPRTFWPHWVYKMYDSYLLARMAADMWRSIIGHSTLDDLIRKPDLLSFYIGSKIPVSDTTRQELLEINGISYRLRREIQLLESFDRVRCRHCLNEIGRRSDMLFMSRDGPLNAFVNPHGHVHEVMTLSNTKGLALLGRPVIEHSWFPGYAWTIANCFVCENTMGWLFTATKKKLEPRSFWGIRCCQVADDTK